MVIVRHQRFCPGQAHVLATLRASNSGNIVAVFALRVTDRHLQATALQYCTGLKRKPRSRCEARRTTSANSVHPQAQFVKTALVPCSRPLELISVVCFPTEKGDIVCQSCVDIDNRIEQQRKLLHSTTDPAEVERIYRLIAQLYGDRVRLHQNS